MCGGRAIDGAARWRIERVRWRHPDAAHGCGMLPGVPAKRWLALGIAMKWMFAAIVLAIVPATAVAQVQSARGKGPSRVNSTPQAAHNSTAKDTTPFDCEQYRLHPHPAMRAYCQGIENMVLADEARRAGRPAPSASIVELPAMGSAEAKQLGYACIGGQAFKRLANGWEQVQASAGGWQRCRGG